jgi:hypothetical protein
MTNRQQTVVDFVRAHPGCCTMDVVRHEWSGRGHRASYARVRRLVRAGMLRSVRVSRSRVALFVA